MEPQALLNIAFGIAGLLFGFVLHAIWGDIKSMRQGIESFKESVSSTYVRRDDYRADIGRIEGKLDQIFALLTKVGP